MTRKETAKKLMRDGTIVAGQVALKKAAPRGILILAKNGGKWIAPKVLSKVGPVVYIASKAYDAGKYLYDNKGRIRDNGGGIKGWAKTVGQDFRENPIKMTLKTIL